MNFLAIFYVIFFVILMFSIILMIQHVIRHFHKNVQEDNEDEQKMKEKEKKMMIQRTNQKNKLDNMLKECTKEKDKIHMELIKLKKEHESVKQNLTKEKHKQLDNNIMFKSVVNSNKLATADDKKPAENIQLEKCCFVNKYNCSGKECTSGVEKRCGHFSNDDCSNSLKLCKFFNKKECNTKPNNVYCEYDDISNQCLNRKMDYGFEINCGKYDTFVKEGMEHYELNCD